MPMLKLLYRVSVLTIVGVRRQVLRPPCLVPQMLASKTTYFWCICSCLSWPGVRPGWACQAPQQHFVSCQRRGRSS